jgi:hypothetical protein
VRSCLSKNKPGEGAPAGREQRSEEPPDAKRQGEITFEIAINKYVRVQVTLVEVTFHKSNRMRRGARNESAPSPFTLFFPAFWPSWLVTLCGASFAQQATHPRFRRPSSSPSGRAQSGGTVQAEQSSSGNGGTSSVNTVNSTIQVSGAYQGSVPDPNVPQGPLTLNIADAIRRGLRFNLGAISANASVAVAWRAAGGAQQMLPNIYGTLSENGAKIDLADPRSHPRHVRRHIPPPTTVGPFHYYGALANLSEDLSMTSLHNLRQSQASAVAAQMSAQDARELIILAVSGTYLRVLASKANVLSQEAQVKQAAATFKQSEHQYQAGTKASIDRNKSFVEYHTQQQRLTSLRGDLLKQTMQLARLIGLPVGQVFALERRSAGSGA